MSNPQIASNSSSSLLSTISSSAAVMTNPYVYSQTSNVDEFTSTQWVKAVPTSGSYTSNSTLNFDIAKMGLVGRAVLEIPWDSKSGATASDLLSPNFPLWAINEIVLSSQGRTISRLDRSCLMARLAERPDYTRTGMLDNAICQHTSQAVSTVTGGKSTFLSLDFAFNDDQYALDTLFLQSCRISVVIGNLGVLVKAAADSAYTDALVYSEPSIYFQYKNQNQMSSDALTSANYSSGLLSSIIPTMVSESVKLSDNYAAGTANNVVTVELKETSAVENIYVFQMVHPEDCVDAQGAPVAWTSGSCQPLEITGSIQFSSNGQNWFDLPARLIGAFAQESQDGRNAYATVPTQTTGNQSSSLGYVYCLNMAQGGLVDNKVSGLLSMRELSNPTIRFNTASSPSTAGKKVSTHVCYSTRQLSTIVSSSGQINISLSN